METEKRITQAKEVIRHLLARTSRPHKRFHDSAASDNVNRLRALEGLCGHCVNLEIEFRHRDGKKVVILNCSKEGRFPSALYDGTPYGKEAHCDDFEKRAIK